MEPDPLNCNEISVSINGLTGDSIAGLTFKIDIPNGFTINENATKSSFGNSAIGTHFNVIFNAYFEVDSQSIEVTYPAIGSNSAFVPTEECTHIGNIVLDPVEVDCIDFDSLDLDFIPLFNGPLYVGSDFQNSVPCPNYDLECPCTGNCPIDDWRFCFIQDGCGKVDVQLLGLNGVDNVSGIRFSFTFDPELEIDEDLTESSIDNNQHLGDNNWEAESLNITGNTISFFYRNEVGSGTNVDFQFSPEIFFSIYFKPQPGICYDFGPDGVEFGAQSGLFIGDHLSDPDVVFCDNYTNNCPGQVCSDGVTLSGNVLRPTNAGSCDEGTDFGFPYGRVNVTATHCGYEYDFEVYTDDAGYYELEVFPNTNYTIIPAYTDEHQYACGVNSIDIDIIRDLILGNIVCFPYPFSNLAGDLSLNSMVTTYDIALIERYIQETQYPDAGKWRFLPASQYQSQFDGVSCPGFAVPSYDTMLVANVGTMNYSNANFRAIKMGDVDGSCEQCLESDSLIQNPPNLLVSLEYDVEEEKLNVYYVENDLSNVSVVNISIEGGAGVSMKEIEYREANRPDELNIRGSENNIGKYGWVSLKPEGQTFAHGELIASFEVEKFTNPRFLVLNLGELVADRKLYRLELDGHGVEILYNHQSHTEKPGIKLVPNPSREKVRIIIPDGYTGPFEIIVMDVMGRTHEYHTTESRKFTLSHPSLPSGTYPIFIRGTEFSESVRWMKID